MATKKCRIYAAFGVSQTPNTMKKERNYLLNSIQTASLYTQVLMSTIPKDLLQRHTMKILQVTKRFLTCWFASTNRAGY